MFHPRESVAENRSEVSNFVSDLTQFLLYQLVGKYLVDYGMRSVRGDWQGFRDAHIEADWLLIYRVVGDELHLARTGSHADIFEG